MNQINKILLCGLLLCLLGAAGKGYGQAPQIFADGKEVVGSVVKGDKAEITLSTSFEGGSIFYTLDGSEPSFESTLYDGSFTVTKTTGIRAVAYKGDFSDLAEADQVFINIVPNYDLNVSVEGQGTVIKDPADGPYIQDSVVKLKAITVEGWRFAGWSGALKSSFEEGSVVMARNKSVTAKFEKIPKYLLDTLTEGGGFSDRNKWGENTEFEFAISPGRMAPAGSVGSVSNPYLIEIEGRPLRERNEEGFGKVTQYPRLPATLIGQVTINGEAAGVGDIVAIYVGEELRGKFEVIIDFDGEISPAGTAWFNAYSIHTAGGEENITSIEVYDASAKLTYGLGISNRGVLPYYPLTEVTLKAMPDNGFVFMSWAGDAIGTDPNLTLTMDRDKTVEAVFGTNLSTIATGKGKLIIDPPNGPYPYGSKVNITPVPDAGYYLGVWGQDAAGMPKGPIEYEITKANPKITALFVPLKENRFTVTTLTSAGGSVVSNPNSNAYVNGQEVTLTATPDPGYSFVGWTGDIESTANPLVTLADANKTVTAQFRRNIFAPVTLTINAENGTVTRTPSDELYEKGTTVELLAQANPGYTFTGWAGALGGTASRTTLFLDGDKVVTANFKASYQLATETRGPGSVLTTPSSTKFIDGDEVILTASPGEGYGFVGWSGDLESTDQQTTLSMDSNKRVIAHFAQLGTLTTWTRGEGTITRSPDKESYFPGESVILTATPGDGFEFVSWGGQASGTSNPITVTMDRAMSVSANFKDTQAPTVSITSPTPNETGEEVFVLSGGVQDNGKVKTLVWLWKGQEMGELELVDGKFSLTDQKLAGGPNEVTVIATDWGGNEGKASTTPVWNPQRTLRMSQVVEQQEGKRIEVELNMESPGEVAGMLFKIGYDKAFLSDPIVTWSSAVGLAIPLVNTGVEGEIRGTFSLPANALPAGQQLICTMSFRAKSVPETLETLLGMEQLTITNPNGIILSSGTEVISEPVRVLVRKFDGDNNANNKLDVGDATRIQRLLVGLETARSWDVFGNDTNGNDELDPGDVTKVLRTVVAIDPQPKEGGNRSIAKMGGDDSPEKALIKVTEKTGDSVTVQVMLKDMISQISGASFELKYPVEMLRLQGKDSHRRGEMASKAARYMWNVEPSQNDYTTQDGTIAMAAISSEQWSIKEGVLAELTFEVQDGADLSKAVLSLNEVEVSPDGFDNRMLARTNFNLGTGEHFEALIPSIVWAEPEAMNYGEALTQTQFGPTTAVEGDFVIEPPLGTVLPAGDHTLRVSFTPVDQDEYRPVSLERKLTVKKLPLIISVGNGLRNFGEPNPTFKLSYAGFLEGEAPTDLLAQPMVSTTANVESNPGVYPVTVNGAQSNNYEISYHNGSLTVGQASVDLSWEQPPAVVYGSRLSAKELGAIATAAGTFSYEPPLGTLLSAGTHLLKVTFNPDSPSYGAKEAQTQIVVGKAVLKVGVDDVERVYGGQNPEFVVKYDGFIEGESENDLSTKPVVSTTADKSSDVGGYELVSSGGISSNYHFEYSNGKLTISQAAPQLSIGLPDSFVYGASLTEELISAKSDVVGSFSFNLDLGSVLSAGTQMFQASFKPTDSKNYTEAELSKTIVVQKAALTVSVADAVRAISAPNLGFEISYEGFVNKEDKSDLLAVATAVTAAEIDSPVGEYPITLSGAKSNNYAITYQVGTLMVVEKLRLVVEVPNTGEVTWSPQKDLYDLGEEVTLEAIPSTGHAFVEWEGDYKGTDNPFTIKMDRNITLKPKFAKLFRFIGVVAEGKGEVVISPKQDGYLPETLVDIEAIPAVHHEFIKWTLRGYDLSTVNPLKGFKTYDVDMEIKAHFKYTEPEPSIIEIVAMTKAPFAFSFGAKEGRVYEVQSSQDLRSWGTLKTYNGTGTLIRFEDERDQVFPQIYYRVRVVE